LLTLNRTTIGGGLPRPTARGLTASVMVDSALHKEIRHLAVDLGISFQQLAVQALPEFLQRHTTKRRR
jgi:predicted transcriptional regulator